MLERDSAFGFDDGFAFFEETTVVVEIFCDEVSAVGGYVLFGFGVVVGAKADDLLELGFGVFDVNLVVGREVIGSLVGELRVVLFVLGFLVVLVADGYVA